MQFDAACRDACVDGDLYFPPATWLPLSTAMHMACRLHLFDFLVDMASLESLARYVAVAAFTVWKDTFDHGWIMPFLTAGTCESNTCGAFECWNCMELPGMFVWGGGPVVLPMLMTFLTPTWISPTIFLAGISFAEMMPGPVFNISCDLPKSSWLDSYKTESVLVYLSKSERSKDPDEIRSSIDFSKTVASLHCSFHKIEGFLGIQLAFNAGWNWLAGIAVCWAGHGLRIEEAFHWPSLKRAFQRIVSSDIWHTFWKTCKVWKLRQSSWGLMLPGITLIFGAYTLWDVRSPVSRRVYTVYTTFNACYFRRRS